MLVYVPIEDRRNEAERRVCVDRRQTIPGAGCRRKSQRRMFITPPVILPTNTTITASIPEKTIQITEQDIKIPTVPNNATVQNVGSPAATQQITVADGEVIAGTIVPANNVKNVSATDT